MTTVRQTAPAKINLFLEVVGRRLDGFHDLETVMQTVDLADELVFEDAPETTFRAQFETPVHYPGFPVDESNLVLRAVRMLQQRFPGARHAEVTLRKRIPMGGGLAGGSTDAAAALRALEDLWNLGLRREEMLAMALELGSDVPFCVAGGTALCRGRGEIIETLAPVAEFTYVLACPGIPVSTARVFRNLDFSAPAAPAAPVVDALLAGDAKAVRRFGTNRLEATALRLYPGLRAFREGLLEAGLPHALMTGSGSCFFGVMAEPDGAEGIARRLRKHLPEARVWVVRTAG